MNLTINVNDITSYPFLTPIVGTGVSISINAVVTNNVNTVTQTITNNTVVSIIISKSGYNTYSNSFNIYDYNLTIDIILVPVTISSDPNYLKPYPLLQVINIPCSYSKQIINTSSTPSGNISYNLDGQVVSNNNTQNTILNFLCVGTNAISQIKQVFDPLSGLVLWTINYSNTITILEYKPSITLEFSVESSCVEDDCTCVPIGGEFTITPTVILNLNNQTTPTCTNSTLTYQLYNYGGTLVDTLVYSIDNSIPVDNTALTYTYTPNLIGDYTLTTTLENCCTSCINTTIIHSCDYIKITEADCHSYVISNCSTLTAKDSYFTLTDLDNNVITTYNNIPLVHGGSVTIATPQDGVYKVLIKNNSLVTIETYIIIDICVISTCIIKRIQDIFCSDDCGCHKVDCNNYCKERDELNRINLLWLDLQSRINREYRLNSFYTVLPSDELDRLRSMKDNIDKLLTYCNNCGSNESTNISQILNNSNSSDCGCNS